MLNKSPKHFRETLVERDVCIRFFGDPTLLPHPLQVMMAKIELLTIGHKRLTIHSFFFIHAKAKNYEKENK
jgi:hypothetical protein